MYLIMDIITSRLAVCTVVSMKNLSIRLKITIWFSAIMILVVSITFGTILWISHSVMQKNIQDNLIETVENNVDEVEFFSSINDSEMDYDGDQYISYKDGFLEIDDDYLDEVNGISTALYREEGSLIYGENPFIKETSKIVFSDGTLQKFSSGGVTYYLYDRMLEGKGTEGLLLRGIVSENQGIEQITLVVRISLIALPILLLFAVMGGYWVAGRTLKPVNKITEAATQISQGRDLKKRINLGQGKDELHQLAAVFDDMFSRLDDAFQTEQQFTSDASHELRTPMSVIMAQCEYTLEKTRSVGEYEEALQVIQRQGRKMSKLIDDMLCFARLEKNNGSYPMEIFDLTELVIDVCEDMSLLQDKGITLTWEAESDIFLHGNRLLIMRLLTNLISNAYRYGKKNGTIHVVLSQREEIMLKVQDDGIGISKEQQGKIFERFYRAESARTSEGTGLGLAMVQDIAKFHGGEVKVSSGLGQGSTFFVSFPLVEKNESKNDGT